MSRYLLGRKCEGKHKSLEQQQNGIHGAAQGWGRRCWRTKYDENVIKEALDRQIHELTIIPVPMDATIWYPTHCPVVLSALRSDKRPNPIIVTTHPMRLAGRYLFWTFTITLRCVSYQFRNEGGWTYPQNNAKGAMIKAVGNTSTPDLIGEANKHAWK